ncbi:T9SS type B sorting domain-containing protein [Nonlabens sp. Ci31]|uniref:T9SS type B sorting domain-containing protein n=1 Tax=Nonlabens sp. Ci31 TaxID=2608253 RepID=UPI0014631D3B|nr:T9SS type B sorting domain-containing protein [Nonlabens sp. Ci31]QJP33068.1 T9SS type B sorting domain-containing protein [Nonlabens sp. Ci31]
MKIKLFLISLFLIYTSYSFSQITLSYNDCEILPSTNYGCSYTTVRYAKDYAMSDFGISASEEFIIESIDFAVDYSNFGSNYTISIYPIDQNFPSSFNISSPPAPLGVSPVTAFPILNSITFPPVNINTIFTTPVVVPSGTERILIVITKGAFFGSGIIFFAATAIDTGTNWYYGCTPFGTVFTVNNFQNTNTINANGSNPGSEYNWFMKVNGSINDTAKPFTLNFNSECGLNKTFNLNNVTNIQSVVWNFNDPNSGANNTSIIQSPVHTFSNPGIYNLIATITRTDGTVYNLNETVEVYDAPIANSIANLYACENPGNLGFSNNFDTSNLINSVAGSQTNVIVSFFRQNGEALPNPLPITINNIIANSEIITARIAYSSDLCCYSETTFEIITNAAPNVNSIPDIVACESASNSGFSLFNLREVESTVQNTIQSPSYQFYDRNGNLIANTDLTSFQNINPMIDYVTVRITDGNSNCYSEFFVDLLVEASPTLPALPILTSCDDDNNGISNLFDISQVEQTLSNNRTDLNFTYFDASGNDITSSFTTPFTNTTPFNQTVTIEVTDINTSCLSATDLFLETISQPIINTPNNLYSCDTGNGYAAFNLSQVSTDILNGQNNLTIAYYDENDNLINPVSLSNYQNTTAYRQTITAVVSFTSNSSCNSSIMFDIITEDLPDIDLDTSYLICGTEPYIDITVNTGFDNYIWTQLENGLIISNNSTVQLIDNGDYSVEVFRRNNGIICSNIFYSTLNRSQLPTITTVNSGLLGDNFVEIIAAGDGDFEYSINGINYQESNYFENLLGGTYQVFVRDINGCGEDSELINIIDYPKFFTPNADGYNDNWQISGIKSNNNAKIYIYDRYGKLLKQISGNGIGWDGTFNSTPLPSDTYWFNVELSHAVSFNGYFALKR